MTYPQQFTKCSKNAAFDRAEKIRENIQLLVLQHGAQRIDGVIASFGVATFSEDSAGAEELIHVADQALYMAKHSGRNCVVMAT